MGQFFVNGAMTASFIARAPQIRDRIGVSVEEFGLLLTVFCRVRPPRQLRRRTV